MRQSKRGLDNRSSEIAYYLKTLIPAAQYFGLAVVIVSLRVGLGDSCCSAAERPFQATGIKVGEVTSTSAIVWTRLTRQSAPISPDAPMVEFEFEPGSNRDGHPRNWIVKSIRYPTGATVADLPYAAAGATGESRVLHRPTGSESWLATDWEPVDPERDYTRQFRLSGLQPSTRYELQVEIRTDQLEGQVVAGGFVTAPTADKPSRVVFTVSTGQSFNDRDRSDGYEIYPSMQQLTPNFFVHTGDILYYDVLAKTKSLARYHWQRMYGLATLVNFHRHVPSYFIKDDHDTWRNDCWPTMKTRAMHEFTFAQGQAIFLEQVPMGKRTWRTFRWGSDLQVWLVEGRDYRSPNDAPDGPDKTIWGAEQKSWFKETVAASDATFRVLISPTPIVGPDRTGKNDNHANRGFAYEGRELRRFLAGQEDLIVLCGDRHWQYASVDPDTGLREYSCGPASDKHAGGWRSDDYHEDYHRFLRIRGGFLSVTVERPEGKPLMTLRFHDVHGNIQFEDVLRASR